MASESVKLLDMWASPFCMRVKIALGEKGVAFEEQAEDLFGGKSELLLSSNPIYQKVPVLLHDGKPILESTNIVTYIDEAWPAPALMPPCAFGRARARFWADFIDKKVFEAGGKIWMSKGEELEVAKKDFIDILKKLEGTLGDKDYFCGESFGFVDIILIGLASWFSAFEKFGEFKIDDHCPNLSAWIYKCMQRESVSKVIPAPEKIFEIVVMLRKMHGVE